jgi:hypothetical protein
MPTEEAKQQGLPGSDVFRFSHLLYHDDLNRDAAVVHLNVEALKALLDTVAVSQRRVIAAEQIAVKEWLARGGFESGTPVPFGPATHAYMQYVNYENLKIASGFELHLKSRLIANDFVVQEIDGRAQEYKDLARDQPTRPIAKAELFAIRGYMFNGRQNYLPGLRDRSLKFSVLTEEPEYRKAMKLSDECLDIINDYRVLRNQIHLPGDVVEAPNIQAYSGPIVNFIVDFINGEVVSLCNALIVRHKLNWNPFNPLS